MSNTSEPACHRNHCTFKTGVLCRDCNSCYPKVCLQTVSNYEHKFEMKIVLAFSHSLPGNRKLKVPGSGSTPGNLSLCRTSVQNGMPELMMVCEWFPTRVRPELWSLFLILTYLLITSALYNQREIFSEDARGIWWRKDIFFYHACPNNWKAICKSKQNSIGLYNDIINGLLT